MVAQLTDEQRRRGVVTYSSGNHGQAMALAARELGAPAVVVMPTTAPQIKIDGAKAFGAEVIFAGTTSVERRRRAEQEAEARGLTMVPPFDHEWIIAGQGTAGLEILEQRRTSRPCSSRSAAAASSPAWPRRSSFPTHRAGDRVEPSGAAAMKASMDAGEPVTLPKTESIADGLMPVRPGDLTFAHVRAYVDRIVTVDDAQIVDAVLWAFEKAKIVAEPSGAATIAAALGGATSSRARSSRSSPAATCRWSASEELRRGR
jgi:threo-3-hydroxy-L-aspartate ammonia-lyase